MKNVRIDINNCVSLLDWHTLGLTATWISEDHIWAVRVATTIKNQTRILWSAEL